MSEIELFDDFNRVGFLDQSKPTSFTYPLFSFNTLVPYFQVDFEGYPSFEAYFQNVLSRWSSTVFLVDGNRLVLGQQAGVYFESTFSFPALLFIQVYASQYFSSLLNDALGSYNFENVEQILSSFGNTLVKKPIPLSTTADLAYGGLSGSDYWVQLTSFMAYTQGDAKMTSFVGRSNSDLGDPGAFLQTQIAISTGFVRGPESGLYGVMFGESALVSAPPSWSSSFPISPGNIAMVVTANIIEILYIDPGVSINIPSGFFYVSGLRGAPFPRADIYAKKTVFTNFYEHGGHGGPISTDLGSVSENEGVLTFGPVGRSPYYGMSLTTSSSSLTFDGWIESSVTSYTLKKDIPPVLNNPMLSIPDGSPGPPWIFQNDLGYGGFGSEAVMYMDNFNIKTGLPYGSGGWHTGIRSGGGSGAVGLSGFGIYMDLITSGLAGRL